MLVHRLPRRRGGDLSRFAIGAIGDRL